MGEDTPFLESDVVKDTIHESKQALKSIGHFTGNSGKRETSSITI